MLRALCLEFIDAVFPPACFLCGAPAADGACADHVLPEAPAGARCGRCAAPLPPALPDGYDCAACRTGAPPFVRVVHLADYRASDAAREWLLAFKHGGRRDLARPLGAALARRCMDLGLDLDLEGGGRGGGRGSVGGPRQITPVPSGDSAARLVPVPLHPLRRLARGYDQARLLAEELARHLPLRVTLALRRTRATAVQGEPGARSRTLNVRGAFAIEPGTPKGLAGRHVWLVDDVLTSGATAAECARVLRRAGARSVGVVCLARAAPAPIDR